VEDDLGEAACLAHAGEARAGSNDTNRRRSLVVDGATRVAPAGLHATPESETNAAAKSTGSFVQLGGVAWAGTTSMTLFNGTLYIIQDDNLWRVNPVTGGYTSLGPGWGGPTLMAGDVTHNRLWIVQAGRLWKVDPGTGNYSVVGNADWSGATSMASQKSVDVPDGDDALYIIQNSRLHWVSTIDGHYTVLGGAAWPGPTLMAFDGVLQ